MFSVISTHAMRATRVLLLVALSGSAAAQAADDGSWQFGPLRFGMSAAQARAAMPDTEWQVLFASTSTGIAYEIKASQLLELGGQRYDVRVGSRYGGSHHWELLSTTAVASVAACEARTASLIAELERRFGAFDLTAPLLGTEKAIPVGKASRMKTDAARGLFVVRAKHSRTSADDIDILVRTDYDEARGRECAITAQLDGQSPPPQGLNLGWDPERVIARPTIAYRNRSLRSLGVPAQPLTLRLPCTILASNGRVGSCVSGPANETVDPYRKLASNWALRYQLDIGATDAQDLTRYPIEIPVTMSAADVREVDLDNGAVINPGQLRVVRGLAVDPADYAPRGPQFSKMSADITVRCKVQEDGSVICGLKPGTTSPAEAFTLAAIQFAENLEVDPKLRDGSSAVGGFIERRLQFKDASSR